MRMAKKERVRFWGGVHMLHKGGNGAEEIQFRGSEMMRKQTVCSSSSTRLANKIPDRDGTGYVEWIFFSDSWCDNRFGEYCKL